MTITVTVHNFTGRSFPLDVDPASKISVVKAAITRAMGKQAKLPLEWRGHELRDHQTLSHYGIAIGDVLHILPPSKVAKTSLQFEKSDGSHFTLQVNSDATVAQLKREIAIEEKVDVRSLRFVFSLEDPDDAETLLVSEARDMLEHAAISQYPLADATIFIWGPPPPITPPTSFYVCVILDDERKLQVEVTFQLTLNDFREAVRLQHNVPITDDVLILVGKELIGDEIPIWDLGFVPDCVVHAVSYISFNVEIVWEQVFDTMLLHPLTRLSTIRRRLEQESPEHVSLDRYWFTVDGMGHLNELRRLWDLDIISGSTLYMRTCLSFKVIIEPPGDVEQVVDAEEEETIWGLKERLSLIIGAGIANMNRHGKLFQDDKKVKDEGLVGGETLLCMRLGQDSSGITEYVVCVL